MLFRSIAELAVTWTDAEPVSDEAAALARMLDRLENMSEDEARALLGEGPERE